MIFKKKKRNIDFLIIGTQKGGTSALDYYLRQHPEIGMANSKELHYFDDEDTFSKGRIKYSNYEKRFNKSSQNKILGEATPIYLYWTESCKRIWEYNRDIKLIAILRNPVDRAFSHWNMEYDRNAEKENFSFCINNETERMKEALPFQHRVYSYVDRGFYSEQIRRYKRYFNDEQMLFIKYEDFKDEQENYLNNIFQFLNVDSSKYLFEKKTVHKRVYTNKISEDQRHLLINVFHNDIKEVERLLNWDCKDWLI